jgi:NADPH-dependent 2,4-dienoyl-CoA reductase/sulfur reductase-like enzyme/rhodanese-related sulfurtransferase
MSTPSVKPARKRIVIVGGVAGGMSTATRLRRLDENANILVLEKTRFVSYANCGLPYHLSHTIERREFLVLQNPDRLRDRFNIDVRVQSEVVAIDRVNKTVTIRNVVEKIEYKQNYDVLVLAPGGATVWPDVANKQRIMAMRTVEDIDRGMAWLYPGPESALVIGAGFIGIEVAENLLKRGMKVTLIHRSDEILRSLDPELAVMMVSRIRASGIDFRFNTTLESLTKDTATLSDGDTVAADVVFSAIGIVPETALAAEAGLTIGSSGGIWVDEYQRTSDPSIYAVGDAAEKIDGITGEPRLVMLAGLANRHGQAAANHIANQNPVPATPALGAFILTFNGFVAASVGQSERSLRARGITPRIIHIHPTDHAGYYPGAETMRLKLLVDAQTDLILGAQAVGGAGIDKRIDVISTAMFAGVSASALAQLEFAYDPQHGSAKDPVNMLGYVNRNLAQGLSAVIEWHEVDEAVEAGAVILDVRTEGEYKYGHMKGSINIPLDTLRESVNQLRGKKVITYCQFGQRGYAAERVLRQQGIDVVNLNGGYLTYKAGISAQQATA